MASGEGRPVLAGIAALIGVGLVVGLVLGFATLGVTKVLGVGGSGDGASTNQATGQESLYLPMPQQTESPEGPTITLVPDATEPTDIADPTDEPTEEETPAQEISLSAGQRSVGSMQRIDLTGVYPGGEGAILMVQRFDSGSWVDFNVTMSVSGEIFSTYIQTGRAGENRFRVRDTDSDLASNEVRVNVG